jgi:conserved oligomeric Golgi complex subunit 6
MSIRSPLLSPQSAVRDTTRSVPQSRNPISLRLYKVLGTNFNDEASREALRTLSDLYVSVPPPGSQKGKEVQREIDEVDDDDAEDDALWGKSSVGANDCGFLENIPGESASRARKNLRRDMENKLAEGSRQFLKAFGEVDQVGILSRRGTSAILKYVMQKLNELQAHVDAMRSRCDDAEAQLQLTNEASKTLLERAGSLRRERYAMPSSIDLLNSFPASDKKSRRANLS